MPSMKVALTVNDFLRRAEQLYPLRTAVIDEPDQPAASWGSFTYAEMTARARAQAAALDTMGIRVGERVAIVSHNSARLLTALFGVSGSGRVLVPINFRLVAEEVRYIVAHSGARVLMVDPELDEALADVACEQRYVIGSDHDAPAIAGRIGSASPCRSSPLPAACGSWLSCGTCRTQLFVVPPLGGSRRP